MSHLLPLYCAVLLAVLLPLHSANAQTDVIRGRVTDADGAPLAGVRVTATSIPGNVTRGTSTNGQGRFQIAFPGGPGDYIMGFAFFGYTFRQFEIKRLADEDVLIADARLAPMEIDSVLVIAPKQERVNRNAQQQPDLSGTERFVNAGNLPAELRGDIAAMAASLPGVLLLPGLDGDADGFSVLGLSGDQNSVTLNGLPSGTNTLPRDAAITSTLTTSPYDVARGGFSGANFNIRSRSGSNYRTRGMSLVTTTPQMQWTDAAARSLGNDYTNVSLGGLFSGPIKLNKSFYNVSYQLGRQVRDNQTLLNTSALGLQTAGLAADSVSRFLNVMNAQAVPLGRASGSDRLSDNGSLFGSVDFSPPNSNSGHSFGLTFNGNWRKQAPVGGGVTQLESAGGERTNWGGGLQARHSGYLGMVLSETTIGGNVAHDYGDPYLDLPSGRVRISSIFAAGGSGVQSIAFGGNQGLSSATRTRSAAFKNTRSWFDNANKHRLKLSTELQYNGSDSDLSSNLLGSFYFNSLADFEARRPASFTRTLVARERATGVVNGSIALGDSYRRSPDLQFQYGVRLDAGRYTTTPAYNPLVESTFGRRNDRVPTRVAFSPRVGLSWTVGRTDEIASFVGAMRSPRAVVRAGIGMFANAGGSGQIGAALDNTGLSTGAQQIVCIGPASPAPDWDAYADNLSAIPKRCADGSAGTVFSNGAPNVTLFAEEFAPHKTLRSNLSWGGNVLDGRFALSVEATYSLNLNQQRSLDLNFNGRQRFTLADDGRPVYVAPTSIVATTGAIAAGDARVSQSFARVSELRSDLRSRTAQLSVQLRPIARTPRKFGWNASYTYANIREQVTGFSSTAGDPLRVEWTRSAQGPHQVNYTLSYRFFDAVSVSWSGSFRSGMAFTPMVAGDINGDGYSNDRAFIFATSATPGLDDAVRNGMGELLAKATGATRSCLEEQSLRIAARNSCRGPWISSAWLNITLDRAKFRMPQRGEISFSLSNPLGAADLLVNGPDNLKGWGQSSFPDQALLYVRGFDAATQRYRYEVNQRFGATRPQYMTMRSPVTLTATVRIDLGPTRERQMLSQQLAAGRRTGGSRLPDVLFRSMGSSTIMNPAGSILRSQDTLQLSALQADSIAAMNRRYTYRADSLWSPVARHMATLPDQYDEDEAYQRYIAARHAQVDMLTDMVRAVRALLSPQQLRKLPPYIVTFLDPRYLAMIRNGTPTFISAGGFMPFGMAGMSFVGSSFSFSESSMVIMR